MFHSLNSNISSLITTRDYSVSGSVDGSSSSEHTQDVTLNGYTAIGVMDVVSYSSWVLPYAAYLNNGTTLTVRAKNVGTTQNTVSVKCTVLYVKNL